MSGMFGGVKIPTQGGQVDVGVPGNPILNVEQTAAAMTPPPSPLNPEDPAVVATRDAATAESLRPKGRAANMLTGGSGLLSSPSLARRTLLGS